MNPEDEWTRTQPEAPTKKPSQYYWYWDDLETEPWVVEVWPLRYLDHFNGWWSKKPIDRLLTKPKKEKKTGSYKGKGLLS